MTSDAAPYKFRRFDRDGRPVKADSALGLIGFSETVRGELDDADPTVAALRAALAGEIEGDAATDLVRSFCVSWLTGSQRDLGRVVAFAVPMPDAVDHVCRIGVIGRTAKSVTAGAVNIATTIILLDAAWDLVTTDLEEVTAATFAVGVAQDVAADIVFDAVLPKKVVKRIDDDFGRPGEESPTTSFTAEPVLSFLRLCRFREVVAGLDCDEPVREQLLQRLDQRIFALFLVNSRQTEGLVRCGAAETSAAVVAHAAMALGLIDSSRSGEILERLAAGIETLDDEARASEARTTLAALEENLSGSAADAERRMRRHGVSSTTSEAADLVAYPISATFELFGSVASGLGKLAGDSKAGRLFALTEDGFNAASKTVDATPDAIGRALQSGVTAEEWVRGVLAKVSPFGR